MSLLNRIRDAEQCKVAWCSEERVEGTDFCGSAGNHHLTDFGMHRLQKLADGTYAYRDAPRLIAKDMTGGSPA